MKEYRVCYKIDGKGYSKDESWIDCDADTWEEALQALADLDKFNAECMVGHQHDTWIERRDGTLWKRVAIMSDFDQVVHNAMFAADTAAINARREGKTNHEITWAAVTEAFKLALGNGLIAIISTEEWPEWIAVDPPYDPEVVWLDTDKTT